MGTDSQSMAVLKRADCGEVGPALCREAGIITAKIDKWRARSPGGMCP